MITLSTDSYIIGADNYNCWYNDNYNDNYYNDLMIIRIIIV